MSTVNLEAFRKDNLERIWRTFYTTALGIGTPLLLGHLSGLMSDVASGQWHAAWSVLLTVGTAAVFAGVNAVKNQMAKGVGDDPSSASLKGALKNGQSNDS